MLSILRDFSGLIFIKKKFQHSTLTHMVQLCYRLSLSYFFLVRPLKMLVSLGFWSFRAFFYFTFLICSVKIFYLGFWFFSIFYFPSWFLHFNFALLVHALRYSRDFSIWKDNLNNVWISLSFSLSSTINVVREEVIKL